MSPKRARLVEEPGSVLIEEDEPNPRTIEAYEALSEILSNVGEADAVLRISRRSKTGTLEFCEQIPATPDFSEETVKRSWGGGTYTVQLWGPNPDKPGSRKYIRQLSFVIAGQPRDKVEVLEQAQQAARGGVDPSVQVLMIELATVKGMLAGMQSAKQGDSGNPLDNLEKLTTVMRNLMPAPAGATSPSEILSFARDAIGLAKDVAPDGDGGGSPWGALIEKGISPMIDLIKQQMAAGQVGNPGNAGAGELPLSIPARDTTVGRIAERVVIPEGNVPMWQAEIVKVMPRLIARAKAGKSPYPIAALFVEDAPGGVVQELEVLAKEPAFVQSALTLAERYFPEIVPVRGWFEEFLQALKEELTDADENADTGTVDAGPDH